MYKQSRLIAGCLVLFCKQLTKAPRLKHPALQSVVINAATYISAQDQFAFINQRSNERLQCFGVT